MDLKKQTKSIENNENEYPSPSKRIKTTKQHLSLIQENEDPKIFEEMGIGMLESDDTSSSAASSTVANLLPQICHSNDENSNDCLDVSEYYQHQQQQQNIQDNSIQQQQQQQQYCTDTIDTINDDIYNDSASNMNFIDPNETLVPSSNQKISNSNNSSIEIYVDNNNKSTTTTTTTATNDRIHKRLSTNSKGRSPLAIVSYNNNLNNVNQNGNTSSLLMTDIMKKQIYIPNETFFLYRNRLQKLNGNNGRDQFKKLSDEIVLQIFKWLPKKALTRCSYVCRRFHQLAQDESLWTRLDLGGKILKCGALGKIVSRGVVILRLAQAEMAHPVFEPDSIEMLPEFQTKLQYLDLSMSVITKPSLKMLLSKCRNLKKLSLEHVKLNDDICSEISNNDNLEALNLTMCEGIETWSIKNMIIKLQQLHSLNISWTSLNVESIKALVDNITPNLLRLNISGCRKAMFDSHLLTLSKRCPGLLELDLSDCTALTSSAIDIICTFKELEYLSLSRCYNISAASYMKLNNLTSLSYLDVFGLLSDVALNVLQNSFPTVGINKFIYSSVARPTVGTRRTSIWGLRTRD